MDQQQTLDVQSSYNRIAQEYAKRIFDELAHKPLDRQLLDRFAERVPDKGPACDLGCGPGHVARYLYEQRVNVHGVDLSPAMVELAQQLNPGISFAVGNMRGLDVAAAAWSGIVAFYSIIHIPRAEVPAVLRELKRVLRPGGILLIAFHIGQEVVHLEEWWDEPVVLDFTFFRSDELIGYLQTTGFEINEVIERAPYPTVEHQSERGYIFARKPERQGLSAC